MHTSDPLLADSHGDPRLLGTGPGPTDPIDPGLLLMPKEEEPLIVEFRRPSKQKAKKKTRKFPPPETESAEESVVRTVPSTYGTTDYRELAGSRQLTEPRRVAMIFIAMYLARQTTARGNMLRAKITMANYANGVLKNIITPDTVRETLFPDVDTAMLERKARCLMRICSSGLTSEVKEHAYCHASNKANLNSTSLDGLENYVTRLLRVRPTLQEFMDDNDSWWPDFT